MELEESLNPNKSESPTDEANPPPHVDQAKERRSDIGQSCGFETDIPWLITKDAVHPFPYQFFQSKMVYDVVLAGSFSNDGECTWAPQVHT